MDTSRHSLKVSTKWRCFCWLLVVCAIGGIDADIGLSTDHETATLKIDTFSSVTSKGDMGETEHVPSTIAEVSEARDTTERSEEGSGNDALKTLPEGEEKIRENGGSSLATATEDEEMMVIEESVAGAMKSKGGEGRNTPMNSMTHESHVKTDKEETFNVDKDSSPREGRITDIVEDGVKSAAGDVKGATSHVSNSSFVVTNLEQDMEDFMSDMQEIQSEEEVDLGKQEEERSKEGAAKESHTFSQKARGFAFNDKEMSDNNKNGAERNTVEKSALTGKSNAKTYEMMRAVLPVADYNITGRNTPLNVIFVFPHVKNETRKKELEVVLVFPQNETNTDKGDIKTNSDAEDEKERPEASEKTETAVMPEKKDSSIRRDVYKKYASKYAGMRPPVAILKRNQGLLERNSPTSHRFKVQRTTTSHPMELDEDEDDPMETGASELQEQVVATPERSAFRIVAAEDIASVPLAQAESAPQPSITARPPPGVRAPVTRSPPLPLSAGEPGSMTVLLEESKQLASAMSVPEDGNRMPLYIPTPIQASHPPPPFPSLHPASIRPMAMRKPLPRRAEKRRNTQTSISTPSPVAVTAEPTTESTSATASDEKPSALPERHLARIRPRHRPTAISRRHPVRNETLTISEPIEKEVSSQNRPTNVTESPVTAATTGGDLLRTKPRTARPGTPLRARQEALRARIRNQASAQAVSTTTQGPSPSSAVLASRHRFGLLPAALKDSEEPSAGATQVTQLPERRKLPRRRPTGSRNFTAVPKEEAVTEAGQVTSDLTPLTPRPRHRLPAPRPARPAPAPAPAPTDKGRKRPTRQDDLMWQEKLSTLQTMLVNQLLSIQQNLNEQKDALQKKPVITHGTQRGLDLLPRPMTTPETTTAAHAVAADATEEQPSTTSVYRGVKRYRRPPSFRKVPASEGKETKEKKVSLKSLYKKNTTPKTKDTTEDFTGASTAKPETSTAAVTASTSSDAPSTTGSTPSAPASSPSPATPAEASTPPPVATTTTLPDDMPTELTTLFPDTTVPVTTEAAVPGVAITGAGVTFSPSPQDPAQPHGPLSPLTLRDGPELALRPEDDLVDPESVRRQDRSAFRPPALLEGGFVPMIGLPAPAQPPQIVGPIPKGYEQTIRGTPIQLDLPLPNSATRFIK